MRAQGVVSLPSIQYARHHGVAPFFRPYPLPPKLIGAAAPTATAGGVVVGTGLGMRRGERVSTDHPDRAKRSGPDTRRWNRRWHKTAPLADYGLAGRDEQEGLIGLWNGKFRFTVIETKQ
jgi:hypothetical protein